MILAPRRRSGHIWASDPGKSGVLDSVSGGSYRRSPMPRNALMAPLGGLSAALFLLFSAPAHAGDNDLVLSRLGTTIDVGGGVMDVIGNSSDFRAAVSELGVVLAPRLMSSADSLGFGGFQFSVDMGFTTINSGENYWRLREGSNDPTGTGNGDHGSGVMRTMGIFMRKGMWLPLPSFEFGAGAVHLADSRMWAGQVYAKFSLHEGYHGWPIPSLSIRGSGSRMMGSQHLDLTVASIDASMSKSFGIAGTLNVEPFIGGNLLIIIPRSEVIDGTPHIPDDNRLNFVFRNQADILRNRIFTGFKLQYYIFALIFEADFALPGRSVDDHPNSEEDCADVGAMTTVCDSLDRAGTQETYTISLALDF